MNSSFSNGFSWKILVVVGLVVISAALIAVLLLVTPERQPNQRSLSYVQDFTTGFVDDINSQRVVASFDKLGPSNIEPTTWREWVESFAANQVSINDRSDETFSDTPDDTYLASYTAVYATSGGLNLHLKAGYVNDHWQITDFGLRND